MNVLTLIHFSFLVNFSLCQSVNDKKSLIQKLFNTNGYEKTIRPFSNQAEPTNVHVEMWLYALHNLDEVEQKLTVTGYLQVEWTDNLLNWTPSDYGGIRQIYIPQGNIWKPDLSLQNGFQKLQELGSNFIQVRINSNGIVRWEPFEVFETKCDIDTKFFPFDRQTYDLIFIVWSSNKEEIVLGEGGEGINIVERTKISSEWEFVTSSSSNFEEGLETKIKFSLTIKRRPLFGVVTIILPIVLLSFLGIFTFAIPIDCGERMGYTITVWLAFAVFLTIVSSSLPRNSNSLPIITVYIMIQLIIGTIIVTVSSILARLACRSEDAVMSSRISRIIKFRRNKLISPENAEHGAEKGNENANVISWKEVAAILDFYLFWIFLISFLLTTIIMLLYIGLS